MIDYKVLVILLYLNLGPCFIADTQTNAFKTKINYGEYLVFVFIAYTKIRNFKCWAFLSK